MKTTLSAPISSFTNVAEPDNNKLVGVGRDDAGKKTKNLLKTKNLKNLVKSKNLAKSKNPDLAKARANKAFETDFLTIEASLTFTQ